MQKICTLCGQTFEIFNEDLAFYKRIAPTFAGKTFELPTPEQCPDCRQARRMAFRNERRFYRRNCDATGQPMLSIYDDSVPFPVYNRDTWWSDSWNALDYGMDFDPSRPFFDQFQELLHRVPRLGIVTGQNENCDYSNYTNYSRNSFLCVGCNKADMCFHCWRVHSSESCIDSLQLNDCTLCSECIDCNDCYNTQHAELSNGCSDCTFLYDCIGCRDCIGCAGLRNKQYHIYNVEYSKEDYEAKKKELQLHHREGRAACKNAFEEIKLQTPRRNLFITNCENVQGDHMKDAQNMFECFHANDAQDCRYLESCEHIKDSQDCSFSGWPSELLYETMGTGVNCYNLKYATASWSCKDMLYSDSCHHSHHLFGCVGLRTHHEYCILNKQYSEEQYEKMAAQICESMVADGTWGTFFPQSICPHGYNETVAMEFYPLKKEEAMKRGYPWKELEDEKLDVEKTIPGERLPDTIEEVPDDILNWAIVCPETGRPFRINKQELELYRRLNIPVPAVHPDERHRQRMQKRNPRKLWTRECAKCGESMQTSFAPERKEIVYCESCYLEEVY